MPITIDKLQNIIPGKLIKPPGLKWDSENQVFFHYPHLDTEWGEIRLLLNLIDEGRFLQFRSIDFFTLSENQRVRENQIEIILTNNYNKKSIKIAHDPEDGEVCLFMDLPLLDNSELPQKLFERIFASIRISGGNILRELKQTVENGPVLTQKKPENTETKKMNLLFRKVLRLFYGKLVKEKQ